MLLHTCNQICKAISNSSFLFFVGVFNLFGESCEFLGISGFSLESGLLLDFVATRSSFLMSRSQISCDRLFQFLFSLRGSFQIILSLRVVRFYKSYNRLGAIPSESFVVVVGRGSEKTSATRSHKT